MHSAAMLLAVWRFRVVLLLLLVAFIGTGLASVTKGNIGSDDAVVDSSSDASITRVQDTLQSLLKSLQDLGQSSGQLFEQRQRWCQNTTRRLFSGEQIEAQNAEVLRIQAEYIEQTASLEEAKGNEDQLRAQTMLVQHTINVTSAVLREDAALQDAKEPVAELLANRQQILLTLQAELDNLQSVRSQLQVRVAELRRQMDDRNGSAVALRLFSASLRGACSTSMQCADAEAEARVRQAQHISLALKSLEGMSFSKSKRSSSATETPFAVSFLQINASVNAAAAAADEDDLLDVFGGGQAQEEDIQEPVRSQEDKTTRDAQDQLDDLMSSEPQQQQPPTADDLGAAAAAPAASPPPSLPTAALLAELKAAKGAAGKTQHEWCIKERAHSELLLELARNSLDRLGSEVAWHSDAEAQLVDTVAAVGRMAASTKAAVAEATVAAQRESAFMTGHVKDQVLATKILKQAVAVLKGLYDDGQAASDAKLLATATKELSAATSAFEVQLNSSMDASKVIESQTQDIAVRASDAVRAFHRETASLELARDAHMTERLRLEDSKRAEEAGTKEAATYLQKLTASCATTIGASAAEKQRQAEVRALEDAQRVIEGKAIGQQHSQNNHLRGGHSSGDDKKAAAELSPIERAALTMGVDVN